MSPSHRTYGNSCCTPLWQELSWSPALQLLTLTGAQQDNPLPTWTHPGTEWMPEHFCITLEMITDIEFPLEMLTDKLEIVSMRKLYRYKL